ncbi:hypothetical protein LCDVSa135R [Lymphocystis disease virus 3]|uniref:Uncharacterized protein n=1 Tax=Lymphocystis disease virus 3 TaxID=2560566 RepID=A0A1B2RW47_9VIRU|nr:hypothetical protein BZK12_gp135 [Lymphocystis disease virus Sa]AOC55219.1 hypothetical protein LCDVSa135R [Lymphocystis disease virus 3]
MKQIYVSRRVVNKLICVDAVKSIRPRCNVVEDALRQKNIYPLTSKVVYE